MILEQPFRPLTIVQGDVSWFMCRMFSLSSSTVDKMITARAVEIPVDHPERQSYETILCITQGIDLLPAEETTTEDSSDVDETSNAVNENSNDPGDDESDISLEEEEEDAEKVDALRWIRLLDESDDHVEPFRAAITHMEVGVCREIVATFNMEKPPKTVSAMRKLLTKWVDAPPSHRPFVHLTIVQMKQKLQQINPLAKPKAGRENLLDQLSKEAKAKVERERRAETGEATYQDNEVDPVLVQVLRASFMRPLKGDAKEYCRKGHLMESVFMEQIVEHSREGLTGNVKILAAHSSPLVERSDRPFFVDSADGELLVSVKENEEDTDENAVKQIIPVEFRSSLATGTFLSERNQMEANLGAEVLDDGELVYIHLRADDPDFFKWVPRASENYQLLHHVVIRGCNRGLIAVGNDRKVMFGIFVEYTQEMCNAYLAVLDDLYDRALSWAYGPPEEVPKDNIEAALNSEMLAKSKITLHSFLTSFFTWRKL